MENNFKNNLAFLVKSVKMSQDAFGEVFGLGKSVINQYIKGVSKPKQETIAKIAYSFGFTVDTILHADLESLCKEKNQIPKLNLDAFQSSEKLIFETYFNDTRQKDLLIETQLKLISSLEMNIDTLKRDLDECRKQKKTVEAHL